MKYIDINWHHESDDDPYRLVCEIGADGFEKRKLEFFKNGEVGFASELMSSDTTMLGANKVPDIGVIVERPDFSGKAITRDEFDALWQAHVDGA